MLRPALAVLFAVVSYGCTQPSVQRAPEYSLSYREIVTGKAAADAKLPMLVAVHGLGDDGLHFAGLFRSLDVDARVIVPDAPTRYGDGFSWFAIPGAGVEGASLTEASDRLAEFIAAVSKNRPTEGKPVLTGFSQGGMLSFAVAARHPDLIAAALPLAGTMSPELRDLATSRARELPPIVAFHGGADPMIPAETTRLAVAALARAGAKAAYKEYEGVGHHISPPMHSDYFVALREALHESGGS